MTRVFSGIQPTGDVHLGNLLGAIRNWVVDQHEADSLYCVVDLHALTIPKDAGEVRDSTLRMAQMLMAIGLDPEVCTLFVQSHVPEHTSLTWLLQCTASFGELRRMTQFKDKSDKADFVSAGLLTYPTLMAADVLLYDTDRVPVGADGEQAGGLLGISGELGVARLDGPHHLDNRSRRVLLERAVLRVADGGFLRGLPSGRGQDRQQVRHAGLGGDVVAHLAVGIGHGPHDLLVDRREVVEEPHDAGR